MSSGGEAARRESPPPVAVVRRDPVAEPVLTQARARIDFTETMADATECVARLKEMEPVLEAEFKRLAELRRELRQHDQVEFKPLFGPLLTASLSKFQGEGFWER